MRITADTNILVRAVVGDDKKQAVAAVTLLKDAELIAVPLPCVCEFVWVLRRVYDFTVQDIAAAIEALMNTAKVAVNRPAVDAGLAILKAGGKFADGLIAYEGSWLGAETFFSFDENAVTALSQQGISATLLS
jgi:predicted nucleic-acid-binding protein